MKITRWALVTPIGVVMFTVTGCQDQGKLRVEPTGLTLQLEKSWYKSHSISGQRGEVSLDARSYHTQQITLTATEPKGRPFERRSTWTLRSFEDFGTLDRVTVKKDQTTVVRGGDPLTIKTSVSRRGPVVSLNYTLVGQAGEVYGPRIVKDGTVEDPAKVKILDESGKVLDSGQFRYG